LRWRSQESGDLCYISRSLTKRRVYPTLRAGGSICEKCNAPATLLWIILSEWTGLAAPPTLCETHSCATLLRAAADTSIQNYKKRIGHTRGLLTFKLRRNIHCNFLKSHPTANRGAAVCWSRALPTLRHRLHQQPEVNYLTCFENDDLPCRLHVFHVVCRVNHYSRNRVNNSLQVAGGCPPPKPALPPARPFPLAPPKPHPTCISSDSF